MRWEMRVRASDDREIERSKRKAASDNYGDVLRKYHQSLHCFSLVSHSFVDLSIHNSIVASCRSCACASLVSVDLVVHSLPLAPPHPHLISEPTTTTFVAEKMTRGQQKIQAQQKRAGTVPHPCSLLSVLLCLMPRARMVALTEILPEQRKWPSRRSPPRRGALPRRPSRCSARSARCVCFGVRLNFVVHSVLLSARGWGVDGMITWLIIVE